MRLWVFSDLQLINHPAGSPPSFGDDVPDADVAVVAGDHYPPLTRSLAALAPLAARMPVVYVPGNRDFYYADLDEELRLGAMAAERMGIHLLSDAEATVLGTRFLGTTLWSDYGLRGEPEVAMRASAAMMMDHRLIKCGVGALTPERTFDRNRSARAFLDAKLAEPFDGPTVVVSHTAPHPGSVAKMYEASPVTPSFVNDLTSLLEGPNAPELWVHGANHRNFDYVAGGTRVLSNSRGYPGENPDFEMSMVVEVEGRKPVPGLS